MKCLILLKTKHQNNSTYYKYHKNRYVEGYGILMQLQMIHDIHLIDKDYAVLFKIRKLITIATECARNSYLSCRIRALIVGTIFSNFSVNDFSYTCRSVQFVVDHLFCIT